MSDWFAGAGFGGEEKERPLYRNRAKNRLVFWAWVGLAVGGVLELVTWALVANGEVTAGAAVFWISLGFILIGAGVTSAVGHSVVTAIANDQAFRHGPLPRDPHEAPAAPRHETPRAAGTDADPIPVQDDVIR